MDQPQPTSRQGLRTSHRLSNRLAVHRINPALHTPYRKSMKLHEIVLNQTLSVKDHRAVGGKRLRTREPTTPTPLHFRDLGVRRRQHKPARATPVGPALPLRLRTVIPRRANMGTAIL